MSLVNGIYKYIVIGINLAMICIALSLCVIFDVKIIVP